MTKCAAPCNICVRREQRKKELNARMKCVDCTEMADLYMVDDWVWSQAGLLKKQNCCLYHLNIRVQRALKRYLELSDFTDAPINQPIRIGFLIGCESKKVET